MLLGIWQAVAGFLGSALLTTSTYAKDKILDAICNATTTGGGLPTSGTLYVKLHTGDPGGAGTGSPATETTRAPVTFGASSGGTCTSDSDASWTGVTATGTETISHISIWSASSGGNMLAYGAVTTPKGIQTGDNLSIPSGSLSLTQS
jgi:hypothetical protein